VDTGFRFDFIKTDKGSRQKKKSWSGSCCFAADLICNHGTAQQTVAIFDLFPRSA
jgi:hypothetical protein